jgi:transposase
MSSAVSTVMQTRSGQRDRTSEEGSGPRLRRPYPTDLADSEWAAIEPLLPAAHTRGRPIEYTRREIVNAILYVLDIGGCWTMLPHDLPPWKIAHHYYMIWRRAGLWQRILLELHGLAETPRRRAPRPFSPLARHSGSDLL